MVAHTGPRDGRDLDRRDGHRVVALKEGGTTIATTTLNASGVALFNISTLSPGRHNLRAVNGEDASNTNSTSNTYQQRVN